MYRKEIRHEGDSLLRWPWRDPQRGSTISRFTGKPHHEQYDTLEVDLDEDNPQALYDTHTKYHVDPVSRKLILRPEPRAKKQKRSQKSSGA